LAANAPAGIGREEFFRGINQPVSRVRTITRFDPAAGPFIGAEIADFDLKRYAPDENPRRLSRHTQFSLVAAMLALKDAGLTVSGFARIKVVAAGYLEFDKVEWPDPVVEAGGAKLVNLYFSVVWLERKVYTLRCVTNVCPF
jgi:3-oxoacyl-[acyl-carrier-protein] synthase II